MPWSTMVSYDVVDFLLTVVLVLVTKHQYLMPNVSINSVHYELFKPVHYRYTVYSIQKAHSVLILFFQIASVV